MGTGGRAGEHRFARRGFRGAGVPWGAQGRVGSWRGWREARNRHRDCGRGCSEMAPGQELKAAGGGSGCPGTGEGLLRRGRAGSWGPPEPSWGCAGSEHVGLIVYKAKERFGANPGYLR